MLFLSFKTIADPLDLHSFPTRRSSDLIILGNMQRWSAADTGDGQVDVAHCRINGNGVRFMSNRTPLRSEEHTSELQSQSNLVCRLLLEKKKTHRLQKE